MAKRDKKGLSVEDLKALQARVTNGETLTPEEQDQLLTAEMEQEDAERKADTEAEINAVADRISTLVAKKIKNGIAAEGGTPFDPSTAAKRKALTKEEKAEEYFNGHTDFPWPGIHITDDLQVFLGNVQGENAMANHKAANPGMKHESFSKPQ